jgi:MFS family permease
MAGGLTVGWLTLELTDSPLWVGAAAAARGLGQVGFGVFAGVLIDRLDKRRLLALSQLLHGAVPLVLALLVATHRIALGHILLANLLQGILISVRAPTINTIAFQITGPRRTLNASAAMNMGFNLASTVGPAVAGALIDRWDATSGFLFAATCAFAGGTLVFFIRGTYRPTPATEPFWHAAATGLRYTWTHLSVRRLISLSLVMETFGFSYMIMLPVIARDVLGVDASGLGLLSAMGGVGAMLSTLAVASLGDFQNKSVLLVSSVFGAGMFLVLFGLSRWYALSLLVAFFLSAALAAYDVAIKTLFLLVAGDEVRGRVQSIYTLTYGFLSLGGFLVGSAATAVGAPLAVSVSGGLVLAFIARYLRPLVALRPTPDELATSTD